jgi:hypothetical protein
MKLRGGNGPTVRAAQLSDVVGSVQYNPVSVYLTGGSSSAQTLQDANFITYTGATYYRQGNVVIEGLGNAVIINLDPSVGTVASDGTITRLSSGIMRLLIETPHLTLPLVCDLTTVSAAPEQPNQFVSTVAGSLAAHLQGQVDNRINNTMSMAVNGLVFSTQNHATQSYVRNPNLWCADVNLTCISPWNSNGANTKAGTLITPRHVLNATHYEYNVGNTVRFVAQDGTVHNRTITGKARHPNYVPYTPDLTIYTLASNLPVGITPCKLMPSNWTSYLVQNLSNRPPALGLDQEEKALIIDFYTDGAFLTPTDSDRRIFDESKIGGDSGNPAFLIVNGELVLITVWTYGGAGSGTPVASYIEGLNTMIVTADAQAGVSTGYTVTEADFSRWPHLTTKNYMLHNDGGSVITALVEYGLQNGKMSYREAGSDTHYLEAVWSGTTSTWDYNAVIDGTPFTVDFSVDDVATPDLATFEFGNAFW